MMQPSGVEGNAVQALPDSVSTANAWRSGEWLLLPAQRRLLRNGTQVTVDERVFDLIGLLVVNHESVLSQREITVRLWGQRPVSDNTLRQLVYKARRVLGDDGERQTLIRTLPGRGLQWVAPVEAVSMPDAQTVIPSRATVRKRHVLFWGVGAALVLAVVFGLWSQRAGAPLDGSVLRVAIEPFETADNRADLAWTRSGLPGLLGSLLSQAGGVDVISTSTVRKAWENRLLNGRDRAQQLRFVTGADVLVGARLIEMGGELYELQLHVDPAASRAAINIVVTGENPGILVVDAVPRIRHALGLSKSVPKGQLPHDPFLADAYARGIDLMLRGRAGEARDYFRLCAANAPDFLPAALALAMAQMQSDDIDGGGRTLKQVLERARQRKDALMAGKALVSLGYLARFSEDEPAAQKYLRAAIDELQRAGDIADQIDAYSLLAISEARVQHYAAAQRDVAQAQTLLAPHPA